MNKNPQNNKCVLKIFFESNNPFKVFVQRKKKRKGCNKKRKKGFKLRKLCVSAYSEMCN